MSTTVSDAIGQFGVDVDDHHDRDLTIPVLAGPQAQGDLIVVPAELGLIPNDRRVPAAGVPVIRGEAGGNTHLLLAAGPVYWLPSTDGGSELGTVLVAPDATGYLAHPEHGYTGIAPGAYRIRRQREQADEIRLVAD